jgi:endo-beta-N-acetylglucosaminidase D
MIRVLLLPNCRRYDAVTTAGELRWQNKLCPTSNGPFFDLADALFLNYCWKPCTLPESVTAAGARALDVLVGVDVHGRGCFGGGGHNTGLALAAAKEAGLSAALFAPGWVYENLGKERFAELQEQWWHKVGQACGSRLRILVSDAYVAAAGGQVHVHNRITGITRSNPVTTLLTVYYKLL